MNRNIYKLLFPYHTSETTYFSLHNVEKALEYGTGRGVKVGIIDWLFGVDSNPTLYSNFVDLTCSSSELLNNSGHGLQMANALRAIAPDCEVVAINAINNNFPNKRIDYFEKAIDWAVLNKIDILTYSHSAFSHELRGRMNNAINKAIENGIITTFIHCDNINNLWPYGCFQFGNDSDFNRSPDLNIFHFDFISDEDFRINLLLEAIKMGKNNLSGNELPFFSFSSMSPVLGGFVAILKSIKQSIQLDEIKKLLIDTSYKVSENKLLWYDVNMCDNVADIGKASERLYNAK